MTDKSSETNNGVWNDQMATWYVEKWGEHAMHDKIVELAQIANDKPLTVLDIGCGSGPVVRRVAEHLNGGEVIGVDPTEKMIEYANALTKSNDKVKIRYAQTGAEQLPVDDNAVDITVAINSLHHWQDVPKGLAQVRRVLKSGGKLVLVDELWDEMPEFEKPQIEGCEHHEHLDEFKNIDTIMAALNKAGLTDITKDTHRSEDVAVSVITCFNP